MGGRRLARKCCMDTRVQVFGLMYVGSQATKLIRAAGMLALAPLVDSGMIAAQSALGLKSKQAVRLPY